MEVREFFEKAKRICERDMSCCETCPITEYCSDGIFSSVEAEIEDLIEIVEKEGKDAGTETRNNSSKTIQV